MSGEPDPTEVSLVDASETIDLPPVAVTRRRLRGSLSALFGVLAIVGLVASVVAVWARNVLFDSGRVGAAVDSALQDPAATATMANYLTDQIMIAVAVEDRVQEVLPPALQRLSPAMVGGVRAFVNDRLERLLRRDDVRATIVAVAERGHGALMKLLQGDGMVDGISVVDGEVTVNLLPLLGRGLLAVQDLGFLDDVTVPTLNAAGDPAAQRAELSAALGRELPEGFGELVVYRSERLDQAQQSLVRAQEALVLVKRSLAALLLVTVLGFAASLLFSVRRGRTLLVLLLASAASMVVVRAVVRRVSADAPTLVIDPGARAALAGTVNSLVGGLFTAATIIAVLAALGALVLFLSGDSRGAVALRSRAAGSSGSVQELVASHGNVVGLVAFSAAVVVVFFGGITWLSVIAAVLLSLGGWWAMRSADVPAGA